MVDTVLLAELDDDFEALNSSIGRRSIPPESLLKATVLMAICSIRSDRAFVSDSTMARLFKWFLDLPIDANVFDPTTFTKNRTRLLDVR